MDKKDFEYLITYIKQNYHDFRLTDEELKHWYKGTKNFLLEDIIERLDQHLLGEYKTTYPKLLWLMQGLKTVSEQELEAKSKIICRFCQKELKIDKFQEHYKRCCSVNYIQKKYKQLFNKEVDTTDLLKMSEFEFDKKYNEFIELIRDKVPDIKERKRIDNIITTKNGGSVMFDSSIFRNEVI
jgi:hypothetical protein